MPKSIVVDPGEVRKPQKLKIKDIPINQYKPNFKKELKTFGKDVLKEMYIDMLLIREFESMLNSIKTQGAYQGIEYNHKGPEQDVCCPKCGKGPLWNNNQART